MNSNCTVETIPFVERIQRLLHKIDQLRLPDDHAMMLKASSTGKSAENLTASSPGKQAMGQALSLSAEARHHLELAAYLHDIGLLVLSYGQRGTALT